MKTKAMPRLSDTEFYPTPPDLAVALVDWGVAQIRALPYGAIGSRLPAVLEPSAGLGAIAREMGSVLGELRGLRIEPGVLAVEPNEPMPRIPNVCRRQTTLEAWVQTEEAQRSEPLFVFGNPPFTLVEEHLRLLLDLPRPVCVTFLTRQSFLSTGGRIDGILSTGELQSTCDLTPRPSFLESERSGSNTDKHEVCLSFWSNRNHVARAPRDFIRWRASKKAK